MELTLKQIAEMTGGRLVGDGDRVVTRVRPIHEAGSGDLSFVANDKALAAAAGSDAEALIVSDGLALDGHHLVFHANPFAAIAKVIAVLYPAIKAATIQPLR